MKTNSIFLSLALFLFVLVGFAEAQAVTYSLNVIINPAGGGTVSLSPELPRYPAGTRVLMTAKPSPGYRFVDWTRASGRKVSENPNLGGVMDRDLTFTANFEALPGTQSPPSAVPAVPVAVAPPQSEPAASRVSVPEIEMVSVRGGSFKMGCPPKDKSCIADERPVHEVQLSSFMIGKYPVTQKQWGAVMGGVPSYFKGDDLPVEQVSWNDVQEFIRRLNEMTGKRYRLPTEAEWEYAARGGAKGKGKRFHGHRFLDDVAWYHFNSGGKTQPVGTRAPNELGLHDMIGNVWEWVSDWYDRAYYGASPLRNPTGPKQGSERVYRGQSFRTEEQNCRISMRNFNKPDYSAIDVGFRLVLPSP